ncbi:MAG: 50S ribosomal protein L1 [Oligoflexales bacterium]
MKKGRKYRASAELVESNRLYSMLDGVEVAKKSSYTKFPGRVEMVVRLGVDPRHADQNVRGATSLPHGSGKDVRVVVFARGEKAVEAGQENVSAVGAEDLAQKIQEGWLDFDSVIATPDMMGVVGKLGKILGPRGMMPNPRVGTVTFDVSATIRELKAGRSEFRVDKAGNVHTAIGRVDMDSNKLAENAEAVIDALVKLKPAAAKGAYLKKIGLSATMGPGIKIDTVAYK